MHARYLIILIESSDSDWCGFEVVVDNLDKNIRPSFQRFDSGTISKHWIHAYAVKDRIDLSSYSDDPVTTPIDVKALLISTTDVAQLENDSIILMSRYIAS